MGRGSVIIAVGDEILGGFIADTNSALAARRLFEAGFPVRRIEVIGDDPKSIAAAIERALADPSASRILVGGGVGPTPDDRTHQGVAMGLGRALEENPEAVDHIEGIIRRMHDAGWVATAEVSPANRRMATVAVGATVLVNRRGMAPPVAYDLGDDRWLFVLPGVPGEFAAVLEEELIPRYCTGGTALTVTELRYSQAIEAEFSEAMTLLATEFPGVEVGSYPQSERRELILRIRGDDPGTVAAAVDRLRALRPGGSE